jgi:hypothetical protein
MGFLEKSKCLMLEIVNIMVVVVVVAAAAAAAVVVVVVVVKSVLLGRTSYLRRDFQ